MVVPVSRYASVYALSQPSAERERLRSSARSSGAVQDAAPLVALAQDFSPRYEQHGDDLVTIDVSGLDRLIGPLRTIADELRRAAAARGLHVHVAIAATQIAATMLARARPGVTVVEPGDEAAAVAPLPIGVLKNAFGACGQCGGRVRWVPRAMKKNGPRSGVDVLQLSVFTRWGINTLGALAALPGADLAARIGQQGLVWQAMARGDDVRPLVPDLPDERFESAIELEWPIEGLEPLSFVLTRLLEPLSTRLERRDRGAAVLHVRLDLVTGDSHARRLQLPVPLRDVRTLRTLALLDLESHPPPAAIDGVVVTIDPTPGRVLQHTLFTPAHPRPEELSTLVARLRAVMGEDRVGAPAMVDSYLPGAFEMMPFTIEHGAEPSRRADIRADAITQALRRCRRPVPARVVVSEGQPIRVTIDRRGFAGGQVVARAGPWRVSGGWWASDRFNRDEWDVVFSDGAVCRIFQDRDTEGWFVDAIVD